MYVLTLTLNDSIKVLMLFIYNDIQTMILYITLQWCRACMFIDTNTQHIYLQIQSYKTDMIDVTEIDMALTALLIRCYTMYVKSIYLSHSH